MYPIMSSPGTGLQHLENFTKQLSTPFTITPDFGDFVFLGFSVTSSCIFSSITSSSCSFFYSSSNLVIILFGDIPPKPILAYISSTVL